MSNKTPSLEDLTKLVMFTGRVSEVHLENLKRFPFIFFNNIVDAELNYSIETTDKAKSSIFSYTLSMPWEFNDNLDKRYKALESAVRSLFWKEVKIELKINDVEVYKSE